MTKDLPIGVQFARVVNVITIVLIFLFAFILVLTTMPILARAMNGLGYIWPAWVYLAIGAAAFIIISVPAYLVMLLNKALGELRQAARVWQIALSCIFVFFFPIGTVINILLLYYMLFDPNTIEHFTPKEKNDNTGTAK